MHILHPNHGRDCHKKKKRYCAHNVLQMMVQMWFYIQFCACFRKCKHFSLGQIMFLFMAPCLNVNSHLLVHELAWLIPSAEYKISWKHRPGRVFCDGSTHMLLLQVHFIIQKESFFSGAAQSLRIISLSFWQFRFYATWSLECSVLSLWLS